MATARIADFSVITDGSFEIRTDGDIDWDQDFNLQDEAHLSSRSILAFVVSPGDDNENVRLRVQINGTDVRSAFRLNAPVRRSIHEVVARNVLQAGSNNIDFRITAGSGNLHISDIVLWWQRDVVIP